MTITLALSPARDLAPITSAFIAPFSSSRASRYSHTHVCRDQRKSFATTTSLPTMSSTAPSPTLASETNLAGPGWVLDYQGLTDPALSKDIDTAVSYISQIEDLASKLNHLVHVAREVTADQAAQDSLIPTLAAMHDHYWNTSILLRNVGTCASCVSSVDGSDESAKKLSSRVQVLYSRCRQAYETAALILDLCPDNLFEQFLSSSDNARASEYLLRHSRKMAKHKLSLQEENMITQLSVTGHSAWGSLYTDLSSVLPVTLELEGKTQTMGIATAEAMRDNPDEETRKKSWEAIRKAWLPHQETCAAALNAITGWRLDTYDRRGYQTFLTSSLHSSRMSRKTLDAMFEAIDAKSDVGRKALQLQAKMLRKPALDPWDLFAPAPVSKNTGRIYSFDEGIELIADAVGKVDQAAGDFVRMMRDNKWIEASRGDKKRPGA